MKIPAIQRNHALNSASQVHCHSQHDNKALLEVAKHKCKISGPDKGNSSEGSSE